MKHYERIYHEEIEGQLITAQQEQALEHCRSVGLEFNNFEEWLLWYRHWQSEQGLKDDSYTLKR